MGTILEARVEIYYPAAPFPTPRSAQLSIAMWDCIATWELGKNYGLMIWLDKTAIKGWPPDIAPFDDSDIVGGKMWLFADLLVLASPVYVTEAEDEFEVMRDGLKWPSWRSLRTSLDPLLERGAERTRVLFHRD